jgi:hypothetical protein
MKRVTPSEARRNWFRLLDEVAGGEVVVVERKGQRLVLRRERSGETPLQPDYSKLIKAKGIDHAERWTWEWSTRGRLLLRKSRSR